MSNNGSRVYTSRVTLMPPPDAPGDGQVNIYAVGGNPNGVIDAEPGDRAFEIGSSNTWVCSGGSTWASAGGGGGTINGIVAAQEIRVNGAPGAAGEVLTSNGAGVPPTWQATSGGVWTQAGTVLSPTTPGDTVEVPGTFGTPAISTSEPSGFATQMSPGAVKVTDGFALSIDIEAAAARLALRGDSGGAVTPTIRARDFDDSATTLDLAIGGLTVNGAPGAA
ncbi:MAG: hypothetical protein EBX36_08680, partial [Planctomycetia bacterium]|nr:hypothetical protein [Planctomycetia bacterium]